MAYGSRLWTPAQGIKPRVEYQVEVNWNHALNYRLKALFLFNEFAGTTVRSSALLPNGTITGAVWAVSALGPVLSFSGTTNVVTIATTSQLDFSSTSKFTIIAKVFPDSTAAGFIVTRSPLAQSFGQYSLEMNTGGGIRVSINSFGNSLNLGAITSGTWWTVAMVYDQVNLAGWRDNTKTSVAVTAAITTTSTSNYIGNGYDGSTVFPGKIAWVQMWDRALTDGEYQAVRQNPFGTAANPRLIVNPRRTWNVPPVDEPVPSRGMIMVPLGLSGNL